MELLAPAGNIENFHAALEAGADAVYVGVPGFNARNLARDLKLEEIGAMIGWCRERGKRLYVAANSLLLERELPAVIDTLGVLEYLQPDGLIVQDLGLINLVRRFFPGLKMHASTLAAAHNLQGVEMLARLGCERVVLARELTLAEIGNIAARTKVELEVFVHGAMCFSYSGLCLFSSYLGGKSGLRGRCVQPCRRGYTTPVSGRKSGASGGRSSYLFSMNDLDGLEAVPELQRIGVSSLKIEGRLRSARYVEKVVSAYRLMIDAGPAGDRDALQRARLLVEEAMSRRTGPGYFFSPQPEQAISPMHSGNLGLHLGRAGNPVKIDGRRWLRLNLKEPLALGDRLRLHLEPSGERLAFSLKALRAAGAEIERAAAGENADILLPDELADLSWKHIDCYKIDLARDGGAEGNAPLPVEAVRAEIAREQRRQAARLREIRWKVWECSHAADAGSRKAAPSQAGVRFQTGKRGGPVKLPLEWWLRLDSVKPILAGMELRPDRYVLTLDRQSGSQAGELKRLLGKQIRNVSWALPAIVADRDGGRLKKQIATLIRTGFRCFVLGHVGQLDYFRGEKVFLSADYTLNLLNNQALLMAAEGGFESGQLAIEADREGLREAIQGYKQTGVPPTKRGGGQRGMRLGLTVYGVPPLFTSRIAAPFFPYERPVVSPKGESFIITRKDGLSQTRPLRPFSLLPYLQELKGMGLDYVVVDLTGGLSGKREMQELAERLCGGGRSTKLSTFNYLGRLE